MIQNSNSVGLLYNNSKIRKFCFASDLAGMTVLLQNDTSQDKKAELHLWKADTIRLLSMTGKLLLTVTL